MDLDPIGSGAGDPPRMVEALDEADLRLVWRLASSAVRRLESLDQHDPRRRGLESVAAQAETAGAELLRRDAI